MSEFLISCVDFLILSEAYNGNLIAQNQKTFSCLY